jgi:hypothetical protein
VEPSPRRSALVVDRASSRRPGAAGLREPSGGYERRNVILAMASGARRQGADSGSAAAHHWRCNTPYTLGGEEKRARHRPVRRHAQSRPAHAIEVRAAREDPRAPLVGGLPAPRAGGAIASWRFAPPSRTAARCRAANRLSNNKVGRSSPGATCCTVSAMTVALTSRNILSTVVRMSRSSGSEFVR